MKHGANGKTWREHAKPFLSKALKQAARTWKPVSSRTNMRKVTSLRQQRDRINKEIRKELDK